MEKKMENEMEAGIIPTKIPFIHQTDLRWVSLVCMFDLIHIHLLLILSLHAESLLNFLYLLHRP